ncbi:uncharacterized protein [Oscarella lobularis]|uniref:uncharacterized protein n=1 Tax=Oscarella lobularis TaxID=121494 RepID=UPI0033136AFF
MTSFFVAILACALAVAAAQKGCCGPEKAEITAYQAVAWLIKERPLLTIQDTTIAWDFSNDAGKFHSSAKVTAKSQPESYMESITYTLSTGEAYYVVGNECLQLTLPKISGMKACIVDNAQFLGNLSIGGAECSTYKALVNDEPVMFNDVILIVCGSCVLTGGAYLTDIRDGFNSTLRASLDLDVNARELSSESLFDKPPACSGNLGKPLDFTKSIFYKAFQAQEFNPYTFLFSLDTMKVLRENFGFE